MDPLPSKTQRFTQLCTCTHKKILHRHKTAFQLFPGSPKIPGTLKNVLPLLFFQSTQLFIKPMAARFISSVGAEWRTLAEW